MYSDPFHVPPALRRPAGRAGEFEGLPPLFPSRRTGSSSFEGAERLATFFTLMRSCKRVKLNPWVYLTHVFSVIEDYSIHRLDELTPPPTSPDFSA
ncbi:MAG TPA: transposase domain-containing protein [Fibrobacteria bacterium]|nr:transposase domain-containing protein [Fibrobacteria bacterium]